MNYYSRHIGDYLRDTSHLSLLEHGVYARLLDLYYTTEKPLDEATAARLIGAKTADEHEALEMVLHDFFVEVAGLWAQPRCEREIAAYKAKAERNREVGKLGGRPKTTHEEPTKNPDGFQTLTESNPNQEPVTNNQEPKKEIAESSLRAVPPSPPAFDGSNARDIPERAVVPLGKTFDLPEEWGTDAEALGFPRARILTESERFRQYWTAAKGAGRRKTRRGWRQSWSNWLGKAAERAA
jgi:uncharacterized protein YdaU (DUF1376 family)